MPKAQTLGSCPVAPNAHYCHTSEAMPGYTASFTQDAGIFQLHHDGETLDLQMPASLQLADMLATYRAADRPLPGDEMLFVQEALSTWDSLKLFVGFEQHESGLMFRRDSQGAGAKIDKGATVSVHYRGYLPDGTTFDSSYDRGEPISFPIGTGRVIKGWDIGIMLFNVGGKGTLLVPSELGYGERGAPPVIPPNATLLFDIEVVAVN